MTELVNISAKTLSGQVYTVQIENSKKISDLKDKFSEETKQSLKDFEYKIIFKGAVLKDDEIISDKDLSGKTVVIMIKTKPIEIPAPKTPPINPQTVNIQTIPNIPLHIHTHTNITTGNIPHIMEPFQTMPNIIEQINNLMQVPTIPVAGPIGTVPSAQPGPSVPLAQPAQQGPTGPEQMMMNNFQTMVNNMINSENNASNMHTALVNQMLQQITQSFGPNTTLQSLLSTGLNGQINVPEELDEHHDDEEDGEDEEYKEGEDDDEHDEDNEDNEEENHDDVEEENHDNDHDEEEHDEEHDDENHEDHNIDGHEDEHEEHHDEVNYDLHDDYPEHNQEIANFDKELLKFNLTEKDMKEIEMVATMGYDINEVIEIYLVCNKDINLTLDNLSLS